MGEQASWDQSVSLVWIRTCSVARQPSVFAFLFFFFTIGGMACGNLFPSSEITPTPTALEGQSLHPWAAGKVPVAPVLG